MLEPRTAQTIRQYDHRQLQDATGSARLAAQLRNHEVAAEDSPEPSPSSSQRSPFILHPNRRRCARGRALGSPAVSFPARCLSKAVLQRHVGHHGHMHCNNVGDDPRQPHTAPGASKYAKRVSALCSACIMFSGFTTHCSFRRRPRDTPVQGRIDLSRGISILLPGLSSSLRCSEKSFEVLRGLLLALERRPEKLEASLVGRMHALNPSFGPRC